MGSITRKGAPPLQPCLYLLLSKLGLAALTVTLYVTCDQARTSIEYVAHMYCLNTGCSASNSHLSVCLW